jgi:hypothetical protein
MPKGEAKRGKTISYFPEATSKRGKAPLLKLLPPLLSRRGGLRGVRSIDPFHVIVNKHKGR